MKYISINKAVLRFPSFPLSFIKEALDNDNRFLEIISSDKFREAIFFSSLSLYEELEKFINKKTEIKDREKTKLSIIKYLSRMSNRCTPFGSFASCATASINELNNTNVSNEISYSFRYDMLFLCQIFEFLQNDKNFIKKLRYRTNTAIYNTNNKIRFISSDSNSFCRHFKIIEINKNSLIQYIRKITKEQTSYENIINNIIKKYSITTDCIEKYINTLIRNKFLVSEIEPFVIGKDYLSFLLEKTKDKNIFYAEYLATLQNLLKEINNSKSFNERKEVYKKIRTYIDSSKIDIKCQNILQLDTINNSKNIELNSSIIKQVTECLDMFYKLSTMQNNQYLLNFANRFIKRYEEQEIPLLEALDPNLGIGYIENSNIPETQLIAGLNLPSKKANNIQSITPLQKILIKKLSELNKSDSFCLEISDIDIKNMKNATKYNLPPTMAALFKITKYDTKKHKYTLADIRFISSTAVNLLGRFAYCNKDINNIIQYITNFEKQYYKDKIIAEIAYLQDYRTGNVTYRPFIRDHEIACLTNSQMDYKHTIPISDLMISIKEGSILLRSKRLNKYIIPRLTTAHNYNYNSTSIYRFLCDLQTQGTCNALYFSWGILENILTHFPRVIYKEIILSPERWRINKKEICDNHGKTTLTILNNYIKQNKIPQYVELNIGDNNLFLNLSNDSCKKILIKEINKTNTITINEYTNIEQVFIDNNTQKMITNECIIPLIISQKHDED